MTVSVSANTNVELEALVKGGQEFLDRVKVLKEAKDQNEASLKALNIGMDVIGALNEAQAREQTAIVALEAAKKEAKEILDRAKADASRAVDTAHAEAKSLIDNAQVQVASLFKELNQGRDVLTAWSQKTKDEAETLMAAAKAAQDKANATMSSAQKIKEDVTAEHAKLVAATEAANKAKIELEAKLAAIKAAAS